MPIDLMRDGSVYVLTMSDGENACNRALVDGLTRALDEVEVSSGEAALVTTGAGRFYSTGLDLAWLASGAELAEAFVTDLQRLFARLLTFPMATVAAINGHAFAAGLMLALAHDFRVMRSDKGYLCMPEVDLAMRQALTPGMYALLQARLSPATVHETLVTGRRYTSHEALSRQMVQDVAPEHEVLPRAIEIARDLAAKDRETVRALKLGLYAHALPALDAPIGGFS